MLKSIVRRLPILSLIAAMLVSYCPPALAQVAPTDTAAITGVVSDTTGKPIVGAQVAASGPRSASTRTDAQGRFVLAALPFGVYRLSVNASGLAGASRDLTLQGDVEVAIQLESESAVKTIARVTSRATFNITPASMTNVNPRDKAFQGNTGWRKILEAIPGVSQTGLTNGATAGGAIPDSPFVPVQVAINGALPYETATLLDGMPLIGTKFNGNTAGGGTNLSMYPLNAFDSADVIRGPGNALSIVNSIGGSLVLHPAGVVTQNHFVTSESVDPYGGISSQSLAQVRLGRLSAQFSYGFYNSPGPLQGPGMIPVSPSTLDGQPFKAYAPPCNPPNCMYGSYLMNSNYAISQFPYYGKQTGLLACCVNLDSAWSQRGGSAALTYQFSPRVSAQVFYAGQDQTTPTFGTLQQSMTDNFIPPAGYGGPIAAGTYLLNPTYGAPLISGAGLQSASALEEKLNIGLGQGQLHVAALQNTNWEQLAYTTGSQNLRLYGGGTLNGSPVIFEGQTHLVGYAPTKFDYTCWNTNHDMLVSYATPIGSKFNAGASYVKSGYNQPYILNYTPSTYSTSNPADVTQTTGETRVFAGWYPSQKIALDVSQYFVNVNYHVPNPANRQGPRIDSNYKYSAPRLGFVWHPTAELAFRAAAGGGFSEAPLAYMVGSNGTPILVTNQNVYSENLVNLGLRPETSFGFDLGSDYRLPDNTVVSLDLYRTNLFGQFYTSVNSSGTLYKGLPLFLVTKGNLGTSRYEGILFEAHHPAPQTGVYWSAVGGLTRAFVVSVPPGFYDNPTVPCTNCTNLAVVKNINFDGPFGATVPYAQGLATVGYQFRPNSYADVTGTYYGHNNTYFRPAFVDWDAHLGVPVNTNVSLLFTLRNITGIYGDAVQFLSPSIMSGAPTVSGPPYPLYGEAFGPRTLELTATYHI